MVLDISVSKVKQPKDHYYEYVPYTVHVDDHRILTVVTECARTLSKWLKDVLKSPPNTKLGSATATVLVGLSADRSSRHHLDTPYDILSLCVGSHSILYFLPSQYDDDFPPRFLNNFFDDPRVVVVGTDIAAVAKRLQSFHGIKIRHAVDLKDLVEKGLRRFDIDIRRFDLDGLAKLVLGKRMDVMRPETRVEWYKHSWSYYWYNRVPYSQSLNHEKIKFSTVDIYLCFLIGSELLGTILSADEEEDDVSSSSSSPDSGAKKKKKKKKTFKNKCYQKMKKGCLEHKRLFE